MWVKYTNPKSGDTPPPSILFTTPWRFGKIASFAERCLLFQTIRNFTYSLPKFKEAFLHHFWIHCSLSERNLSFLHILKKRKKKYLWYFLPNIFFQKKPYIQLMKEEISFTFVCLWKNSFQFYLNRRKRIQIYIKLTAFYIYFLQIYLQMWAKKIHWTIIEKRFIAVT